jgi:hypothetical protein
MHPRPGEPVLLVVSRAASQYGDSERQATGCGNEWKQAISHAA